MGPWQNQCLKPEEWSHMANINEIFIKFAVSMDV